MVLVAAGDVTLVILAFCLNGLLCADFNGLLMVLLVRNMNLGEDRGIEPCGQSDLTGATQV